MLNVENNGQTNAQGISEDATLGGECHRSTEFPNRYTRAMLNGPTIYVVREVGNVRQCVTNNNTHGIAWFDACKPVTNQQSPDNRTKVVELAIHVNKLVVQLVGSHMKVKNAHLFQQQNIMTESGYGCDALGILWCARRTSSSVPGHT